MKTNVMKGGRFAPFAFLRRLEEELTEDPSLPRAPKTASPVPRLTSLHNTEKRGPYGDAKYPGNCNGEIIKDLLRFFNARNVFDPMEGSGTCRDVCKELRLSYAGGDINHGFDAMNRRNYPRDKFDFIWIHPPYWRQKLYAKTPRDLSRAATFETFLDMLSTVVHNAKSVLADDGHMAILMGDYTDPEEGFMPLVFFTRLVCLQMGLAQSCTEIIRFQHGSSSSKKEYSTSFIPGLHDVVTIFEHEKRA